MKTRNIIAMAIGISSLAVLNATAGPGVGVTVQIPGPPGVVVQPAVPDSYVWDGHEYVGVVNGQYYYLGPGNVWIPMDQPRWHRFHDWERYHRDWRQHEMRNERYRDRQEWREHHEWEEHEEHERHHDYDQPGSDRYEHDSDHWHHHDRDDDRD